MSYLLSAKVNVSNESYDDKSNLNGFDFRGIFGVEYALLKGFSVSARYQLGLYNINKGSNSEAKNNAFSLTLGYTLDSK